MIYWLNLYKQTYIMWHALQQENRRGTFRTQNDLKFKLAVIDRFGMRVAREKISLLRLSEPPSTKKKK